VGRKPTWKGDWSNPADEVRAFLQSIEPRQGPRLYALHVLLPHVPYQYLPSGRTYAKGRELLGYHLRKWVTNPSFVDFNYERYLLQLAYTDEVLGRIMARLKAADLWDRSLVIVTADHGVSFHPGGHRRYVDLDNIGDIAPIPMFVKTPHQRRAEVDRLAARSIDVVPTIADQLGIKVPWSLDGTSLLARDRQPPSRIVVRSYTGDVVNASWARVARGQQQTLDWKLRLFGFGQDTLYAEGHDRQLIGKRIDAFPTWSGALIRAEIDEPRAVIFDPSSHTVPSRVSGTLVGVAAGRSLKVVVAVNNRIAAVAPTTTTDGKVSFSTLVSDSVLRTGVNSIAIFAVRPREDGQLALARIGSAGSATHLQASAR
jgi:hypothetical protein